MVTRLKAPVPVQGDNNKESLGLVHVYTGDGKGKTSAALGLAMRALGNNLRVQMIQFLKSGDTGELYTVRKFLPDMRIIQFGVEALSDKQSRIFEFDATTQEEMGEGAFTFQPDKAEKEACRRGLEYAKNVIESGEWDLVILDEINCVLDKELLPIEDVLALVKDHGKVELVLTGMDAPNDIKEAADYVSHISRMKHPWQKGIKARKGIEY
ncbi:MAG: cob(I)yrinic acid a,c-diamide adenosyltransferase [archaeon]